MKLGISSRLPKECFSPTCPSRSANPTPVWIVRKGYFQRSSDSRSIARFLCRVCGKSFSQASPSDCFGQKKRQLNELIRWLMVSGFSQRRSALFQSINRKTVARKQLFLGNRAELRQKEWLESIGQSQKLEFIQVDEMESFERSKCLPLSIPIAVNPKTRKILGLGVWEMPAKGRLAKRSLEKYGPRKDERAQGMRELLESLKPALLPEVKVLSDRNPKYPKWIRTVYPSSLHQTVKGRRGCVVGQGELKRGGFDPLFALNHTCAMIRANVNRLFRRTWNTTKRKDRLKAHLAVYMEFHNSVLTA